MAADPCAGSNPGAWLAVLLPGRDSDQVGERFRLELGAAQPFLAWHNEDLIEGLDGQAIQVFTFRLSYYLADLLLSLGSQPLILQVPAMWHNYRWVATVPQAVTQPIVKRELRSYAKGKAGYKIMMKSLGVEIRASSGRGRLTGQAKIDKQCGSGLKGGIQDENACHSDKWRRYL